MAGQLPPRGAPLHASRAAGRGILPNRHAVGLTRSRHDRHQPLDTDNAATGTRCDTGKH